MSTLHARPSGDAFDPVLAAKGVREALRHLRMPEATFARASALVDVAQERGLVLVATHGDTVLVEQAAQVGGRVSAGRMKFYTNLSRENALSYSKTPDPDRDGRTPATRLKPVTDPTPIRPEPEPNAAATMAVMMAMNNGNPLVAAAHCQNLARTASAPVFLQAKALLIEGFPWIKAKLDAGEIA